MLTPSGRSCGEELLDFRRLLDVPLAVRLPQRLAGDQLPGGEVDDRLRLLHVVDQAQHGQDLDEPPGGVGMPAAIGPGPGRDGPGVQHDPAAVPGQAGSAWCQLWLPSPPATTATKTLLRLSSARYSRPRLSLARRPHLWQTELTKPVAVISAAVRSAPATSTEFHPYSGKNASGTAKFATARNGNARRCHCTSRSRAR